MGRNATEELIRSWSRGFRAQELTVEEIQDRFAELDLSGSGLRDAVRERITQAQRELDAIRWGMCAAGQQAETGRILTELERYFSNSKSGNEVARDSGKSDGAD